MLQVLPKKVVYSTMRGSSYYQRPRCSKVFLLARVGDNTISESNNDGILDLWLVLVIGLFQWSDHRHRSQTGSFIEFLVKNPHFIL